MSKPIVRIVMLLCVAHVLMAEPTGHEARLIALERAWGQAYVHRDRAALDKILSADFTLTTSDARVISRSDVLSDLVSSSFHIESDEITEIRVRLYASAAVVTGTDVAKGKRGGVSVVERRRWTDTFVRDGNAWRCVASHESALP